VFRSATEPFDTSTPAGRMLVQMLGVFAEFEREMIIDRVVNGMERKAGKGQWTLGVAPEGYLTDSDTQHLVPVEAEMHTIKEIFRIYTEERVGCRMVAKKINARGMRRRSGALYSFKTIADIVSNPVYIGTVLFRDVEVEKAHPGIHRPRDVRPCPAPAPRTRGEPRRRSRRSLGVPPHRQDPLPAVRAHVPRHRRPRA
jgi:site-specific DNA recombinase